MLLKFLWIGTDKVTRVSVTNEHEEEGGLRMIDLNCLVKFDLYKASMVKTTKNENNGAWKSYIQHVLKSVGGCSLLNCNHDIKDYKISSHFSFWNNKEIRIDNKPVFYRNCFERVLTYIHDLLFNSNT